MARIAGASFDNGRRMGYWQRTAPTRPRRNVHWLRGRFVPASDSCSKAFSRKTARSDRHHPPRSRPSNHDLQSRITSAIQRTPARHHHGLQQLAALYAEAWHAVTWPRRSARRRGLLRRLQAGATVQKWIGVPGPAAAG